MLAIVFLILAALTGFWGFGASPLSTVWEGIAQTAFFLFGTLCVLAAITGLVRWRKKTGW